MLNINIREVNQYIISTIITILIVLAILFLFYFVCNIFFKTKLYLNWVKKTNKKHRYNIFLLFLGCSFSLTSLIFYFENNFNYTIFIFSAITLSYFFNYYFYIGTMVSNIVINSVLIKIVNQGFLYFNNYYLLLNYLVIFLGLIFLLSIKFIRWRNNFIFLFINMSILITTIIITFPILFAQVWNKLSDFYTFSYCFNFIFYLLISYILYVILHLLSKISIKNIELNQENKYVGNFIKTPFYVSEVNKFIKKKHMDQGLLIKFFIFGLENILSQYGNSYYKKIKQKILVHLTNVFSKYDSIFFIVDDHDYYVFIKIDELNKINLKETIANNQKTKRTDDDFLSVYEQDIKKIISLCKQEEIYCSITAICSLYGVINNDINYLIQSIQNIKINTWPYFNTINFESFIGLEQRINIDNKNKLLTELNIFKPNSIFINFKKQIKDDINYYSISAYSLLPLYINKSEIWNTSKNLSTWSALICHTSAKAIIEFVQQKLNQSLSNILIIDYSQYLLEQNNFDVDSLINNIGFYGLNINQFILDIQCYTKNFNQNFKNNLKKLKNQKIKFQIKNN